MRSFLGQSKTIYIYIVKQSIGRDSGFALPAKFRFMSSQNYTDTYTNSKILKGRRECVFSGQS